jgi:hypothetical protein
MMTLYYHPSANTENNTATTMTSNKKQHNRHRRRHSSQDYDSLEEDERDQNDQHLSLFDDCCTYMHLAIATVLGDDYSNNGYVLDNDACGSSSRRISKKTYYDLVLLGKDDDNDTYDDTYDDTYCDDGDNTTLTYPLEEGDNDTSTWNDTGNTSKATIVVDKVPPRLVQVSDDEQEDQTLTVKSDDVSLLEFVRALKFTDESQQQQSGRKLKSSLKKQTQQGTRQSTNRDIPETPKVVSFAPKHSRRKKTAAKKPFSLLSSNTDHSNRSSNTMRLYNHYTDSNDDVPFDEPI